MTKTRDRLNLGRWRIASVPGLIVITLVILARMSGNLQFVEWAVLDAMLRFRPPEPIDERILIVGINEDDIRKVGTYPIPDQSLADLINTLQTYKPTVIGLDIFRDLPVNPGHPNLVRIFQQHQNVMGVEKALPDQFGATVNPPPDLPNERVGFADVVLDADGYMRRSLLGTYDLSGNYKFSLPLQLAKTYLKSNGISLQNGIHDPVAMRFNTVELTPLTSTSGGYVKADTRGHQILMNARSGSNPFRIVSMGNVMAGTVPDQWIRDRIVLIGVMSTSVKDFINSAAIDRASSEAIYGVEIQAHTISQIISAVLDQRPLLRAWADGWEYGWIVLWGIAGIGLGKSLLSSVKLLLGLSIATLLLVAGGYGLLITGWWVPIAPAFLVLIPNGIIVFLICQQERDLTARIQERQLIIDKIFDAIHNGPLQTLARLLSHVQEQQLSTSDLCPELKQLDKELRVIYDAVRQETLNQDSIFYVNNDVKLDLHHPIHEVLYEIYCNTLARDFPCFKTIKFNVTSFEEIDSRYLTTEQKRGLCRFLEEALCNVGKHAIGVTRLEVVCKCDRTQNVIRVTDNGAGINTTSGYSKFTGRGTQQARNLARQLGGKFRRSLNSPQGTLCELTWTATKRWF